MTILLCLMSLIAGLWIGFQTGDNLGYQDGYYDRCEELEILE